MKEKSSLIIALLLAMTSVVSAAKIEESFHTLAICFLVLCVIILIIAIILVAILYRRRRQEKLNGYSASVKGSRYNLSTRQRKFSETNGKDPIGFYGTYNDPQPANSIYLPLEKKTQENGNYAHLEGPKTQEDNHDYEELKTKGTFEAAYDNLAATADNEDDDHDYEVADATIVRPKSQDYDNPPTKSGNTAF